MRYILITGILIFSLCACRTPEQQKRIKKANESLSTSSESVVTDKTDSNSLKKINYAFTGSTQKTLNVYSENGRTLFSIEAEAGLDEYPFLDSLYINRPADKFSDLLRCEYNSKLAYILLYDSGNPDTMDASYILLDTIENKLSHLDPKEKNKIYCAEDHEEFE